MMFGLAITLNNKILGYGGYAMGLGIKILGPWELTADGDVLPLTGNRRIGLLTGLASSAGRSWSPLTSSLTDVWGENRVATAPKAAPHRGVEASRVPCASGPRRGHRDRGRADTAWMYHLITSMLTCS
ncbi:hypothetical protein GCM10020220_115730 [Nonomuraea rubra]|uniref:hypothetical protein n=1 Tax=Nonomuraea rubra TaxID=46180 RepID=UPI0031EF7DCF